MNALANDLVDICRSANSSMQYFVEVLWFSVTPNELPDKWHRKGRIKVSISLFQHIKSEIYKLPLFMCTWKGKHRGRVRGVLNCSGLIVWRRHAGIHA